MQFQLFLNAVLAVSVLAAPIENPEANKRDVETNPSIWRRYGGYGGYGFPGYGGIRFYSGGRK